MDFVHLNILLTIKYNMLFYTNFSQMWGKCAKCEESELNVENVSAKKM